MPTGPCHSAVCLETAFLLSLSEGTGEGCWLDTGLLSNSSEAMEGDDCEEWSID